MKTLIFYLLFEMFSLLFLYIAESKNKKESPIKQKYQIKKSLIFLVLSFIPLLVLVGFRNINVGVDTKNYAAVFSRIASNMMTIADRNWIGLGYILICKVINLFFGSNYIYLNLVIGFLTLYFFYKGIWENSEKPTISLYILLSTCLFYQAFNQARQMLAIAIVFYSFKYLFQNNFKKYLIFIIIASSIHTSALIMVPFYFICKLQINKKNILLYCLIATSCIVFFPILEKIIMLTNYGNIYKNTLFFSANKSSTLNLLVRIALLIICFILKYYSEKKIIEDKEKKCFNLVIWCILFQIIATRIYIIGRVTTYFYIIFIIFIPNLANQIKNKELKKIVNIGIIICFLLYHLVYFKEVAAASGYDIYHFFFN